MMNWQKLNLPISSLSVDPITEFLEELGVLSVTLQAADDEELFEPLPGTTPLWNEVLLTGLFDDQKNIEELIPLLKKKFPNDILKYTVEILPDQNWQENCTQHFQARCFSNKLWICPSWDKKNLPHDGKPVVYLDPGLAFGSGDHPTTKLCLEWLAEYLEKDASVIDYGCGSGILSLAALKLGAKKVWAVDIDSQALESTLDNAKQNQIADGKLQTFLPETLPQFLKADLLVANILANPLIELASHFSNLVTEGGQIVLSGILVDQIESIIQAYQHCFTFSEPKIKDEWGLVYGKKR